MVQTTVVTLTETTTETPKPPRKKRRSWLRRGFVLLLLLGILGWFGPTIVAKTELRNQLPKLLLANTPVVVHVGDATLNWLSPVVINDLRVEDAQGNAILELKQFSSSLPLWTLATLPEQLGTFTIDEPVIHLSVTENGSNLEDLLRQFASGTNATSSVLGYGVDLHKGRIEIVHVPSDRTTSIEPISVRLNSTHGKLQEVDVAIGTPLSADGTETVTDWIAAKLTGSTDDATAQHLMVRASHWKLERLAPLLARVSPQAELAGELNADTTITLTTIDDCIDIDWNGTLSIQQLLIAGLESLKRDRLLLNEIAVSGRAATNAGRMALHDFKLSTDVGELTATGDVPLNVQSNRSPLELLQSLLSDEDYHIDGHVDLKKLAALLPQTLRVREGTEITAGDLKLQLVGGDINGARRWSGTAGITGLKAINQGKTIPWDLPLAARVNAHREGTAIKVDLVECKSDFLQVAGNGTLDDARFTATGDLSKLVSNLERFVDLGIEQLSGQMKATGELKRRDDQHVELASKVVLDNFAYVVSKTNTWREKHLELSVASAGQIDTRPALTQIDSGELHLISTGDSLDLVLKQPINLAASTSSYAAVARLKGNLASWQNRLRTVTAVDNWTVGGAVDLSTTVTGNSSTVDVSQLTCAFQKLEVRGPEWLIQDPEAKLETIGKWNLATQTWTSPKTSLVGKTVSVDVTDLECGLAKSGLTKLVGTATYRADMAQVSGWKNLAIPNPSYYLIGSLTGTASITRQADQFKGTIDAQVEKFVLAGRGNGQPGQPLWVALWKEPQIKVGGQGTYDVTADKLSLESSRFDVVGLSLDASGKLENCSTQERINLTGNLDYDWDTLANRFGPQVNQSIRLSGKDRRQFSLHGSLASLSQTATRQSVVATPISFPGATNPQADTSSSTGSLADLSGQAGLGWSAANIYGIQAGAGDVSIQLDRSVCRFAPIDLTVNDGKLHTTPTLYLDRNPFTLVLPQEKMIDQVSLSPELCNNWLKFVTPMLADSAQVDGKLSVDLRGASFPLSTPKYGTADGVLTIHRAQAKPGPMALQVIDAVEQVQSLITRRQPQAANQSVLMQMPEQQIPFKLEQGRVYHQGLTLLVNNVTVRTSGSVGVDSTLNVTAEIGIRDEWIGSNKVLAGLKGKSIPIQIVGSTSQPQIDPSAFANLAQQLGGSAIEGLIQDKVGNGLDSALNNGLDKLFRGKK